MVHHTTCVHCDGKVYQTTYGPVHEREQHHRALTHSEWTADLLERLNEDLRRAFHGGPVTGGFLGDGHIGDPDVR